MRASSSRCFSVAETQYSLRGNLADPRFVAACESALGVAPPSAPNSVSANIFWLGPDEWLVVGRDAAAISRLREALRGIHSALVDVSSNRVVLELSGPQAEETLSKACTLDFHLRSFPVGSCAQTNIARTQGLIYRRAEAEFQIFVRPSCARYLEAWLRDAMAASL